MENISEKQLLWFCAIGIAIMLIGFLFVKKSGGSMSFGMPKINLPKKDKTQTPPISTPGVTE